MTERKHVKSQPICRECGGEAVEVQWWCGFCELYVPVIEPHDPLGDIAQRAFALLVSGPGDCDDDPDDVVKALGEALGVEPGDSGFKHWRST